MKNLTKDLVIRALIAFVGCVFIAIGISLSGAVNMGMDPFSALWVAVSKIMGVGLGNLMLVVNLIIFAVIFLIDRSKFGLGTFINWIFTGYMIQFFGDYFISIGLGDDYNLLVRVVLTLVSVSVLLFGAALYMSAGLGMAPLDAIAPVIEEKTKLSYVQGRMIHEILCLVLAFFLGGPVGLMTIYMGFFAGPMIAMFRAKLAEPLVKRLTGETLYQ
ncbi:hypothetical protein EF384_03155 [Aerococcus agrisoli]|uniref:YitT family protein n=1 Tax=Aerococcus agrisoli TaxID=2487350 RepID=A0A3N4GFR3_9LACT|nr:hypothetical protein [Aerococcus agrisoli]RPA61025.1 hypothetical protein EF384_03155 [Aerococcus agrisoli]